MSLDISLFIENRTNKRFIFVCTPNRLCESTSPHTSDMLQTNCLFAFGDINSRLFLLRFHLFCTPSSQNGYFSPPRQRSRHFKTRKIFALPHLSAIDNAKQVCYNILKAKGKTDKKNGRKSWQRSTTTKTNLK